MELGIEKVGILEPGLGQVGILEVRVTQIKTLGLSSGFICSSGSICSWTPSDDGENSLDISARLLFRRTFLCFPLSRRVVR
jgi:hypothetical protein